MLANVATGNVDHHVLCSDDHKLRVNDLKQNHFWTQPYKVYKCLVNGTCSGSRNVTNTSTALLGGLISICNGNHAGLLCQGCRVGFEIVAGSCQRCDDNSSAISAAVQALVFAVLCLCGFQHLLSWQGLSPVWPGQALSGVLFDFIQSMSLLSVFKFNWPQKSLTFFTATGFSRMEVSQLTCFTSWTYEAGLILSCFAVPGAVVLFLLYVVIRFKSGCSSKSFTEWLNHHGYHRSIPRASKFLYILVAPTVAKAGFVHFQCAPINDGEWVQKDLEQNLELTAVPYLSSNLLLSVRYKSNFGCTVCHN
jgi:hypothetical protein